MRLNKKKFLETEFGAALKDCIKCWDTWIATGNHENSNWCRAQWEVYKMALRQFYRIEYCFTRTDEYYGVVTEDEKNWLFKVER